MDSIKSSALPSLTHIALACVVVKSKPVGIQLEDYIQRLRQSVIKSSTTNQGGDRRQQQHQQISGALYWKQACGRLEVEKVKLQNQIFDLERLQPQDKDHDPTDGAQTVTANKILKRGVETRQNVAANTRSKRRKLNVSSDRDNNSENDEEIVDVNKDCGRSSHAQGLLSSFIDWDLDNRILLRGLYRLNQVRNQEKICWNELNDTITIVCQVVQRIFVNTCQPMRAKHSTGLNDKIFEICKAIKKVWILVLNVLLDGSNTDPPATGHSSCIPYMVELFRCMLSQLQYLCNPNTESSHAPDQLRGIHEANTGRNMEPDNGYVKSPHSDSKPITNTMSSMFSRLDMTQTHHCKVFEGLACILLDSLGSNLSLIVLGDTPNASDCTRNGAHSDRAKELVGLDSTTKTSGEAAPFMIHILRAMLAVSDRSPSGDASRESSSTGPNTDIGSYLVSRMRDRLQHTLLRGVYGDKDPKFLDALTRIDGPDQSDSDLDLQIRSSVNTQSLPEWFVSQLWEHLGWDILVDTRFGA